MKHKDYRIELPDDTFDMREEVSNERLTVAEMEEKYPLQWLGIVDPIYKNNDGINLESGIVRFSHAPKGRLTCLKIRGEIQELYTTIPGEAFYG